MNNPDTYPPEESKPSNSRDGFIVAALFLTVCVFLCIFELMMPVDYFCFRTWEALRVHQFSLFLSGPFYPNIKLFKTEVGDLKVVPKVNNHVYWETDSYGFRYHQIPSPKPIDVVLIGDSFIAGSALTQADTMAEVLERKLDTAVYPYATATPTDFFFDQRFFKHFPKVVVFIPARFNSETIGKDIHPWKKYLAMNITFYQRVVTMLDRLSKMTCLKYLYAHLSRPGIRGRENKDLYVGNESDSGLQLFKEKFETFRDDEIVAMIRTYADFVEKKGSAFLFCPLPDKRMLGEENVLKLMNLLGQSPKVETINLYPAFKKVQMKSFSLYHTDDSHWNKAGVLVAADLLKVKILELLRTKGKGKGVKSGVVSSL